MNPIKRLGLIIAVALTVDAFIIAPAFPRQGELATLNERVSELYQAGKFAEAVPLAQRALAIAEKARGRDDPAISTSLVNLAMLYIQLGRYADAELLYRRALRIRDDGPDHPELAKSLDNLASLYERQGRHADAEPLYKRCWRSVTGCSVPIIVRLRTRSTIWLSFIAHRDATRTPSHSTSDHGRSRRNRLTPIMHAGDCLDSKNGGVLS